MLDKDRSRFSLVSCLVACALGHFPSMLGSGATARSGRQHTCLRCNRSSTATALAGAVTLVADKDKVLSLETVGFADIAAGKAMRPMRCSGSPRNPSRSRPRPS